MDLELLKEITMSSPKKFVIIAPKNSTLHQINNSNSIMIKEGELYGKLEQIQPCHSVEQIEKKSVAYQTEIPHKQDADSQTLKC